jgi:hypothetical protein
MFTVFLYGFLALMLIGAVLAAIASATDEPE